MRFYLYVQSRAEAEALMRGSVLKKTNCMVYILSQMQVPQWFQDLAPPMFADVQEGALYYGDRVAEAIKSKSMQALDELHEE